MNFVEWLTLATVCLMGAVSPGPSLLVVLNQTLNRSRLHGVVTAVSHGAMVAGWALVTVLGVSQLLIHIPMLQTALTLFAVVYLCYLALGAWRGGGFKINTSKVTGRSLVSAASDGAAIALFNPKLALFFLAIFAPFVHEGASIFDQALLVVTPWITDTGWYLIIALTLSGRKGLALLEKHQQKINRVLAVALLLLAGLMLFGL